MYISLMTLYPNVSLVEHTYQRVSISMVLKQKDSILSIPLIRLNSKLLSNHKSSNQKHYNKSIFLRTLAMFWDRYARDTTGHWGQKLLEYSFILFIILKISKSHPRIFSNIFACVSIWQARLKSTIFLKVSKNIEKNVTSVLQSNSIWS